MFYSDKPQELAANVRSFVAGASPTVPRSPPKAIVAPHAGYIYSGPIAGSAYAALASRGNDVERVILVGPSHRVAFPGVATSGASVFETPLGPMHLDRDAIAQITNAHLAREFENAHQNEHSLEVQLPFLKQVCPHARIVPVLSGDDDWQALAKVIDLLWGGQETALVVSSDLSHYHDYATAKSIDAATAGALEKLSAGQLDFEQACGATAVNALLSVARSNGMECTTLDLRNSGDTAGPRDRVVGYGAFALG